MDSIKNLFKRFKDHVSTIQEEAKKVKQIVRKNYPPEKKEKVLCIEFSLTSVAKATFLIAIIVLLCFLVYEIRDVIIIFFVALLFSAALDPTVDKLQEYKVPRWLGIILIYIFVIAVLGIFISNLIPLIGSQIVDLASKLRAIVSGGNLDMPKILDWAQPYFQSFFSEINKDVIIENLQSALTAMGDSFKQAAGNVFSVLIAISNGVFNFLLILVLTFFMVVNESGIDEFVLSLFPSKYAEYISEKSKAIKQKVGYWLRGQLLLGVSIGLLSYIGFLILGVEYAPTLAIFAGITEVIPYVGPFLAWIVSVPIVLNQSPWLVLWVTIMFLIVQRLENDILVPLIMKKATGLSPILVIFAMMVGFQFMGIVGLILSIPIASTISIFVHDYTSKAK